MNPSFKFSPKISTKIIAMAVLLVGFTAFFTNRNYFHNTQDILVADQIGALEEESRLLISPIRKSINELKIDLTKLHAEPALLNMLANNSQKNIDALADKFRKLLLVNPNYFQARFIDENGQELLSLDRKGRHIIRGTRKQLQNKAETSYFKESIEMKPGLIYLSEIEPNREFGRIIRPITLVLRAVLPVYRKDETLAGLLVINLNMSRLLNELSQEVQAKRSLYVTNTHGEYLWHPKREYLLGVTPEKITIQDEFPKSQQVVEGYKRKLLAETKDGKILSYIALPFDALNPHRLLGVGLTAQRDVLLADIEALHRRNNLFSIGMVLLSAFLAAVFGRVITAPLKQVTEIAEKFPEETDTRDLPAHKQDETGALARSFIRLMREVLDREWLRTGQLNVVSSIRGNLNVEETAAKILKSLCNYLEVPLAALYQVQEDDSLRFIKGYAIDGEAKAEQMIAAGDSVLATVLDSGVIQVDNEIPENYFRIHSGLGETRPVARLIAPIILEDKSIAVIELAGVKAFSDKAISLMEHLSETIGLGLLAAVLRENTVDMLTQSRAQEAELSASNEQLEVNAKSLEEKQEELQRQAAEMEAQNFQLEEQKARIEEQSADIKQKMAEIERVSTYKSEFLANMSHELRTPLNSLLILAKSFQDNEDGNLTPDQVEEAGMIYSGGVELLSLINDVLDFSKIEAGQVNIIKNDVPIQTVVQKLAAQFLPLARERGVELLLEVNTGVPETIHTDGQRLEQVLKNFLSNAIKFTEEGSVTLKVFHEAEYDRIAFAVADTGIGINPDKQGEIFEAFRQEDGSIDRKFGGTGLGLSISQQLAKLLGGKITLNSQKDRGSTFILHLPVTDADNAAGTDENSHAETLDVFPAETIRKTDLTSDQDEKTLLVVEDDQRFAATLRKLANKKGYVTYVAHTGKDALMMAHIHKPRGIILDLMLPDMDGMKVLEQLKGNIKTRHIPVHVVSARNDPGRDSLKKGAIGYLSKPVNPEQMDAIFARVATVNQETIKHVLVIEDDEKTQKAVKKLLQGKDVEITCVSEGRDGLEKLNAQDFDCVILDLQLPDMTGFDWLRHVESNGHKAVPPVVVYTARKLTREETRTLEEYTGSIIIKGAHSPARLVDEVMLFLHSVEENLNEEQRRIITMQYDSDEILKSRKILLVDDDMRNVFAMSKMLKKQGMEVVIADNGQMALEQLDKEEGIDLVVMDIMMPVMGGYEATQKIRQHPVYKDLPVIALTARTMPDEREKCLAAGANDYLAKPVDIEVLLTLMRVLLFEKKEVAARC